MKDLKQQVQEKADQIADERYGVEFYELSDEVQNQIYTEALEEVNNDMANLGDYLIDLEREK